MCCMRGRRSKIYAEEALPFGGGNGEVYTHLACVYQRNEARPPLLVLTQVATIFLCGAKGWPEGAGNEPSRRDEAELKWNCEEREGNRVNRRRRYKNKKYCARKALIVLFALASLLWLFHPFLSSERTLEWGKKSLRILQKGWQCVLCSSESIQWEVCDDKYILGKLSFHLFSMRHGLPCWTVFGYSFFFWNRSAKNPYRR